MRRRITPRTLLKELDGVGNTYWKKSEYHWTNHGTCWSFRSGWGTDTTTDFITYATAFGLDIFVRFSVEELGLSWLRSKPSLIYAALRPTISHPLCPKEHFPNLEMIHWLLEHGADPNQQVELYGTSRTIWEYFLCDIIVSSEGCGLEPPFMDVAKLFLQFGSDPRARISDTNLGVSARECLRYACPESQVEGLGRVFEGALAKSRSFQSTLLERITSQERWNAPVNLERLRSREARDKGINFFWGVRRQGESLV